MRIYRRRFPRIKSLHNRHILFYVVSGLIIVILIIILDIRLKPVIRSYVYEQAVYLATVTVNDAVNAVLSENDVTYSDLITFLTDENGKITALNTDAIKINRLKSEILDNVTTKLDNLGKRKVRIPLSIAIGMNTFSRLSPRIGLTIEPFGTASAEFTSEFIDAGINQTLHRIVMKVTSYVTVEMPRYSVSAKIESGVSIAETIIVGSVPDSYTS